MRRRRNFNPRREIAQLRGNETNMWKSFPSRFSFANQPARRLFCTREDPAILLPTDPLLSPYLRLPAVRRESDLQQSDSEAEAWGGSTSGGGREGARLLQRPRAKSVAGAKAKSKSEEIRTPSIINAPNQFVRRPREASALQRNARSGRSPSAGPSPYLRQTHKSVREWRRGGMAARDGAQ